MVPDLVYDVGMNNGDDSAFYLAQGYRVLAVEADPALGAAAEQRFHQELASGRFTLLNVGIAESDGNAEFWICDKNSEWNSFDRAIASRDNAAHHAITIPTRQFGSILQEFGVPYYLKIDIEGQDRRCLMELGSVSRAALPRCVSWENDGEQGFEQLEIVHGLGYSRFKLIDQSTYGAVPQGVSVANALDSAAWHLMRRLRRYGIPGQRVVYSVLTHRGRLERRFGRPFPMGCSGPLGDSMPGRWVSFQDASALLAREVSKYSNGNRPAHSFWCDWHASL